MKARVQGKFFVSLAVLAMVVLIASPALAGFIDFEDGTDGAVIRSTIKGLEFYTTDGYDWVYGDWRTDSYNGPYPYGPDPTASQYWSEGNFFAWLGTNQGRGVIVFTESYATYFQIGYSAYTGLTVEAYDYDSNMVDTASGGGNLDTGRLDYLRVESPGMAYVIIHDTGNYWLVDNLETDAIQQCTKDEHCDDGLFCNGQETCVQYLCIEGVDPCEPDETCNEDTDTCDKDGGDDDSGGNEEDAGVKSVGGCGCAF